MGGVVLELKKYFKSRIGNLLHTKFPKLMRGGIEYGETMVNKRQIF